MSFVDTPVGSLEASTDRPATRLATRLAFLVAGFGIACWAPLVPFAKQRLAVDDGVLGLLLLCIGVGSVVAMLATGPVSARYGARPVIIGGGFGLSVLLPLLAVAPTVTTLALALLLFGASLGSIDVAMNVHAVEVERAAARPLMSGFHALFSIGGFAGSTLVTVLLSLGLSAFAGTLLASAIMLAAMGIASPRLLRTAQAGDDPLVVVPRGIVLLLAALAAATFLVEGAMLDWSAVFITVRHLASRDGGGLGYILFAIAMTVGRLFGDALVARIGDRATLVAGGLLSVFGFAVLLLAPMPVLALSGFVLIGLGASNLVPVLFRRAGSQRAMPPAMAISAITTVGYAGILLGPAAIGFVSRAAGLPVAFAILAVLMLIVPLTARIVAGPRS
ncbi:MAG: MFS transporter [Gluconacetobacter diazotrophicus]|nr:MFS transporter [Gluconacetobacter diazotrophicus]